MTHRGGATEHRRPRIGALGRLIGLDVIEALIEDRFDELERLLAANATDQAALEKAGKSLRDADATVAHIEPLPPANPSLMGSTSPKKK